MPRVISERERREKKMDNEFRMRLGGYMAVSGKSLADLAAALGISVQTMYNYREKPGMMRLREYRRLMDIIGGG